MHLGPYPLERLRRLSDASADPPGLKLRRPTPTPRAAASRLSAVSAYGPYVDMFDSLRNGEVAGEVAPFPKDPQSVANNLKASVYFLDADMAGTCLVPTDAWRHRLEHHHALVVLIRFKTGVTPDGPGAAWLEGAQQMNADLRAAEVAAITAAYVRYLGFAATAHTATASDVDLERLALQCGLAELQGGRVVNPWLDDQFGLAAVTTTLAVAPDAPLARRGIRRRRATRGARAFFGLGGIRPTWSLLGRSKRPVHLGPYPMEKIKRVKEPTTLVIPDEIARVPQRASFFDRALHGDLGTSFVEKRHTFAYKTPQAQSYVKMIRAMVPMQDGPVARQIARDTDDPDANSDAVKALGYFLGGDMVGICRADEYAWYSHDKDGKPINPDHANAVVILLDQGYETMEGASGDDWISGAQSMRAYMRGAEIAGIISQHIRNLGYSARSHTNAKSQVLHIPLILNAGLGELSRIGELVLNPFVGPRFKSVVLTTDMPLTADKPIDFGLQDFCAKCTKCARECPCGAISFAGKVMFNGYEMWKPDVEKCAKYRLGNLKGSACGRCMKTCPFNAEGLMSERFWLGVSMRFPFMRRKIAEWDDLIGNGSINPVKKWWWDLEWIHGRTVLPTKGTNARTLDFGRMRIADTQKIALYTPDMNPAPDNWQPVKLNRELAIRQGAKAESPEAARLRLGRRR